MENNESRILHRWLGIFPLVAIRISLSMAIMMKAWAFLEGQSLSKMAEETAYLHKEKAVVMESMPIERLLYCIVGGRALRDKSCMRRGTLLSK